MDVMDIGLLGVASDGSVEQWDGVAPFEGIMLRWFHRRELGFPAYGYDLYRARVAIDPPNLDWRRLEPEMSGRTRYVLPDGVVLESDTGFRFEAWLESRMALRVSPGEHVRMLFPRPVWYIAVSAAPGIGSGLKVALSATGLVRETRSIYAGEAEIEFRTRGVETLELTGDGGVRFLRYEFLDAARSWQHLGRVTLPVKDPGYPAHATYSTSDAEEARRRVPSGVNWTDRYAAGFQQLHPYLVQLATGEVLAGIPPSTQENAPELEMDAAAAVELATLDPHIARMVGLAWDDPIPGGLDGKEWAYRITGHWRGPTLWETWLDGRDGAEPIDALAEYGVELHEVNSRIEPTVEGIAVALPPDGLLEMTVHDEVDSLLVKVRAEQALAWRALSQDSGTIVEGVIPATPERGVIHIPARNIVRIALEGPVSLDLLDRERLLEHGVDLEGGDIEELEDRWAIRLEREDPLLIHYREPIDSPSIRIETMEAVRWWAEDDSGEQVASGELAPTLDGALATLAEQVLAFELTMGRDVDFVIRGYERLEEIGGWVEQDNGETEVDERGDLAVRMPEGGVLRIMYPEPHDRPVVRLDGTYAFIWRALDEGGSPLAEGELTSDDSTGEESEARWHDLAIDLRGIYLVEIVGPPDAETTILLGAVWASRARSISAILPSVRAEDPGGPVGPSWLAVDVTQPATPSEPLQASLSWDLARLATGAVSEHGCVFYQLAARTLSADPSAPPPPPAFARDCLLKERALIAVPQAAAARMPQRFAIDRPIPTGWRCWWVRGVDLFGRTTEPSPPVIKAVIDNLAPPAPLMVSAEYIQADLPQTAGDVLSRSTLARAWMAAKPAQDAVVVTWAWTPELDTLCPDVNAFRIHTRRPMVTVSPDPAQPGITFENVEWTVAPSGETGTIPVRFAGAVTHTVVGIPTVNVTAVRAIDDTHAMCTTNLSLETGAGVLIGAKLTKASGAYVVVGNGDGPNTVVFVEHPKGKLPAAGTHRLEAGTSGIVTVATRLSPPALSRDPFWRRTGGILTSGSTRLAVLSRTGGTFICKRVSTPDGAMPSLPSGRSRVTWYPAYAVAMGNHPRNAGFGPRPTLSEPVAHAQITVSAVRRSATKPVESPMASPAGLTAVDMTPPPRPQLPIIPSGPYCAELATRADWYGVSRFTLSWPAQAPWHYVVYRALGEEIFRRDRAVHETKPHSFPSSAWPPIVWNDVVRKAVVQTDLAALDDAIATGDDGKIRGAYRTLRADTQQLIAGQEAVRGAYVAVHAEPLMHAEAPYIDTFDGRSRGHWFYRVASRSPSGIESAWSAPTPPICAPDVVAPEAPLVQRALSEKLLIPNEEEAVERETDKAPAPGILLQWLRSPEADLDHYVIYRVEDEVLAADVRTMTAVAVVLPEPGADAGEGKLLPRIVEGQPRWLEFRDEAPAGQEWLYRIVAVDEAGNHSRPSGLLRGRAIVPPPTPPILTSPSRNATFVTLSWTHPSDQRLCSQVERRSADGGLWQSVSGWLPRGVYIYADMPLPFAASWKYRLRVRDHLGQVASTLPEVTLPAEPGS